MSDEANRTEQPTPRRLERARKEGNVAVSREFISGITLLCFVWLLDAYASDSLQAAKQLLRELFLLSTQNVSLAGMHALVVQIVFRYLQGPLLVGIGLFVFTLSLQLASTQLAVRWNALKPDFTRLNSFPKVMQLPGQNGRALVLAILLLLGSFYIVWRSAEECVSQAVQMARMPVHSEVINAGGMVMRLLWSGAILLFLFGCIDLFRQQRKWWSQLRMSKQEVKEEHKEMEGNPLIRMRIRRLQREASRHRMMQDVPKATAVVVNPTHYAVALRYHLSTPGAPKVIAKGQNWQALRIREIAIRHEIPIIENPPLARALYASAEVGQEIPPDLYQAVAEVLAYIYRLLDGRLPGKESMS